MSADTLQPYSVFHLLTRRQRLDILDRPARFPSHLPTRISHSFPTYQIPRRPPLHPRTRFLLPQNIHRGGRKQRRRGVLTKFHALQMQTHVCFVRLMFLFLHIHLPACIRSPTSSHTVYSPADATFLGFPVAVLQQFRGN